MSGNANSVKKQRSSGKQSTGNRNRKPPPANDYSAVPPPPQLTGASSSSSATGKAARNRPKRNGENNNTLIAKQGAGDGSVRGQEKQNSRPLSAKRPQRRPPVVSDFSMPFTRSSLLATFPWIQELGLQGQLDSVTAARPQQPALLISTGKKEGPVGSSSSSSSSGKIPEPDSRKTTQKLSTNDTQKDRRLFFDEYWSADEVEKQLKDGRIFQGELRINKRRRHLAYVTVDGFEHDFVVVGSRDQNRALNGDRVAVKVLGKALPSQYQDARSGRDLFNPISIPADQHSRGGKLTGGGKSAKEIGEDNNDNNDDNDNNDNDEEEGGEENMNIPHPIAQVVCVIEQRPGQTYSGFLMPDGWRPGMNADDADRLMGYDDDGDRSKYQHHYPPISIPQAGGDESELTVDFKEMQLKNAAAGEEEEWVTDEDDDSENNQNKNDYNENKNDESENNQNKNDDSENKNDDNIVNQSENNAGYHSQQQQSSKQGRRQRKKAAVKQSRQPSKNLYFKPCDNRAPFILIDRNTFPEDFQRNFQQLYRDKLYMASIHRWPATTMHPYGVLGKAMGDMGDILVESEAILESNSIRHADFSSPVLRCLPPMPWSIGEDEVAKRLDLRAKRIFTIDPETARDLDDAVSCERQADGNFMVGVHIADVSHFVRPGTALDREARTRATTTYLVQKAVPMLPRLLCENLCSLNPGVDRLAFSVMWRMSPDARILDTWFGRTIIRSCVKMSYENAQRLIDGQSWQEAVGRPLADNDRHTEKQVIDDVHQFHRLSLLMRQRRFENGALTINQPKLTFRLDETGHPSTCSVYEIKDSNRLIEEFMLLANMSVAKKISDHFPTGALLRCHPPPKTKIMQEFLDYCRRMGQEMSAVSAAALQQSILRIADDEVRAIFQLLAVKPMQRARYFCTGDHKDERSRWRHYALSVDLYTHFTSPIRRYADVIVHRLLQAAIDEDAAIDELATTLATSAAPVHPQAANRQAAAASSSSKNDDDGGMKEISLGARQCNLKKEDARAAQDASSKLFLCVYLRRLEQSSGRPMICDAVVMDFGGERGMDVYIPQFALDRRVFLDDCGVARLSLCSARDRMSVQWLTASACGSLPPFPSLNNNNNNNSDRNNNNNNNGGRKKPPPSLADPQTGDLVTVVNARDTGGLVQSISLLDHVFVRLSVEGRSPMDVKAYLVHPDHPSVRQVKRYQFAIAASQQQAQRRAGSSSVLEETFEDVD